MKVHAYLALAFVLMVGCTWSPERDNTVDPKSRFYIPPPPPLPVVRIDTVWMTTSCTNNTFSVFCAFNVMCRIYDPNQIVRHDSIMVRIDTLELGSMAFNPEIGSFYLQRAQDSIPGGSLGGLVGKRIWVRTLDTLGRQDSAWVEFHTPVYQPPAHIIHPVGAQLPEIVFNYHPRLGWAYWGGPTGTHHFAVSVKYLNLIDVWDTTGLAPSDTFVVITDSLHDSALFPDIFYSWTLSVINERGDEIVSQPGLFQVLPPAREIRKRTSTVSHL